MNYNADIILHDILSLTSNIDNKLCSNDTINIVNKFKLLSKNEQIMLLNNFLDNLNIELIIKNRKDDELNCQKNGHIYSKWYEGIGTNYNEGKPYSYKIWCNKCDRCGHVKVSYIEPIEHIKEREEKELVDKIDFLQKRLVKLRDEK